MFEIPTLQWEQNKSHFAYLIFGASNSCRTHKAEIQNHIYEQTYLTNWSDASFQFNYLTLIAAVCVYVFFFSLFLSTLHLQYITHHCHPHMWNMVLYSYTAFHTLYAHFQYSTRMSVFHHLSNYVWTKRLFIRGLVLSDVVSNICHVSVFRCLDNEWYDYHYFPQCFTK